MNKVGNSRNNETQKKIYRALVYLLEHKSFDAIYVKDICAVACINRSTFYEHYQDINDLMMQTEKALSTQMGDIFKTPMYYSNESFVKMFKFIKENKEFYTAYLNNNCVSFMGQEDFKEFLKKFTASTLKYDFKENEMIYHMAFFSSGLSAICKVWLKTGLKESPEEMAKIIYNEYDKNSKYFT